MKQYTAFLRGINISGKNKLPMPELKAELEAADFSQVSTYMNSGNVSLSMELQDTAAVRSLIEARISNRFGLEIPVYVIEMDALHDILCHALKGWGSGDPKRYDQLIFTLSADTPEEIVHSIGEPSEGLETVQIYQNIIFWTFDRKAYQKCRWWRQTARPGIAEKLTIRTANTVKRLCK